MAKRRGRVHQTPSLTGVPRLRAALRLANKARAATIRLASAIAKRRAPGQDAEYHHREVVLSARAVAADLMSSLDWAANEFASLDRELVRADVYFPIANPGVSEDDFGSRFRPQFRVLQDEHQAIWKAILDLQSFRRPSFPWLSMLKDLRDVSTHVGPPLHGFTRVETRVQHADYEDRQVEFPVFRLGPIADLEGFLIAASEEVQFFLELSVHEFDPVGSAPARRSKLSETEVLQSHRPLAEQTIEDVRRTVTMRKRP